MSRQITGSQESGGQVVVIEAVGQTADEFARRVAEFSPEFLRSFMAYLDYRYDGALNGFAAELHAICVLDAARRFAKQNPHKS